jgi:HEAT repeat protein
MALCLLHSAPLTAEPYPDQAASVSGAQIEEICASLIGYSTKSAKLRFLERALAQAQNPNVRGAIVALAEQVGGSELEDLLIHVIEHDPDVGIRLSAVAKLARYGTARSVQPLLTCAQKDPTGEHRAGCIVSRMTARREAYFALAELGLRLPSERKRIADAIRKLPVTSEDLHDPKIQALYILTGDNRLLRPFFERLRSPNPQIRVVGLVTFRFLKLKRAPKEVTQLIHDPDQNVRSWVALILGEIGDPGTIPMLMDAAKDRKKDRGTRCNAIYSLGRMCVTNAEALLKELLSDEDVKVSAAVALSQITGQRHPLVPHGYRLD